MPDRTEELEAKVAKLTRALEKQIARSINDTLQRLEEATGTGIERAEALRTLPRALDQAGLSDVRLQLEEIFADELREIRRELSKVAKTEVRYTTVDAELVEQLLDSYVEGVFVTLEGLNVDIQSELTRQVLIGDRPNLDDILENATPRQVRNINTELNTATLAFSRSMTVRKADELGLTHAQYTGPNDKVTRPFCDHLLGDSRLEFASIPSRRSGVYTLAEVQRMDNGQGLDVRQFAGGWNCRHRWSFITETRAKELGYPN